MEVNIDILKHFFESPNQGFLIRELAKKTKINHTTVRKYILYYLKEDVLCQKKGKPYALFLANQGSKKYKNLKLYYNLEKIRNSNLIEDLEKAYDLPVIVLFGSYTLARDDTSSDIDICLISNVDKEFQTNKYEKSLNRKISLHKFSENSWDKAKKSNPNLINNICNGIVLSGELVVL